MDVSGIVTGAVGLLMTGPVIYVVTRQASQGAIDVNAALGIRTKSTRSSQQAWEVAHRAALPWVAVAAVVGVSTAVFSVTSLVLASTVGSSEAAPVVVLIAGYVGLLVLLFVATSVANRAARATGDAEGR